MLYCLNPACSYPDNPDINVNCQGCGFPLTPSKEKCLFQNRYKIIQFLGKKDHKRSYLAHDTQEMDELRVIKKYILSSSEVQLQQAQKQFDKIANQLSKLNHPQIAKIYAYFVQNNCFYLVEEYLEGKSLLTEIEEKIQFSETEITIILRELLPVLSYLHHKNIIHGKLNLKNIIRPLFFLALKPEEEAVAKEVLVEIQSSDDSYIIVDPWIDNNNNQLLLPSSLPNHDSSESQSNLEQVVNETTDIPENKNQKTSLELYPSTLGRGKKLVLINVSEGQLFPDLWNEKHSQNGFSVDLETDLKEENKQMLPANDIYDLGVICIRSLTGYFRQTDELKNKKDPLYNENNKRWLWREVLASQHKNISADIGAILDKMLQSSPTEGYQSAVELIKDLHSDAPLEFIPIVAEDKARFKRRRFLALAGWGSVGLISAVGVGIWLRRRARGQR